MSLRRNAAIFSWGLQHGTATRLVGWPRGPAAFPSVAPGRNTPDVDGRTKDKSISHPPPQTGHAPKSHLSA